MLRSYAYEDTRSGYYDDYDLEYLWLNVFTLSLAHFASLSLSLSLSLSYACPISIPDPL